MSVEPDPFAHHPELRDKITDPRQSFLRNHTVAELAARMKEWGLSTEDWHTDEARESMRAQSLVGHRGKDLWVFGYGSLMWDPGFRFVEVRRARAPRYDRRFILKDTFGARGTLDKPGLMAALDIGEGCDGLLFRIAHEHVEEETEALWRREQIAPAYFAKFIPAFADGEPVLALTFVADHGAKVIDTGLSRAQQIQMFATGSGFLGSSLEYLRNVNERLVTLGIHDEHVSSLLQETEAYIATL